jgi:hypothetical protein
LQRVEACELRAPEQAQCGHANDVCAELQTDLDGERGPLLSCSERVQSCLDRVGEEEVGGRACEAMADACERAEQRGLDDEEEGGEPEADDEDVADPEAGDDAAADDEDEAVDDDDDDDDDDRGRPEQPGQGRGADAGPVAETPVARGRDR